MSGNGEHTRSTGSLIYQQSFRLEPSGSRASPAAVHWRVMLFIRIFFIIPVMSSKQHIRQHMRQRRRRLSPSAQQRAAESLCQQLLAMPEVKAARHIAAYWPSDGEISPLPLLRYLKDQKRLYLPVVLDGGCLHFKPYRSSRGLWRNRYRIPEPVGRRHVLAQQLDVVLMPLVAFDQRGNRLGMGGGYYDRSFAFKREQPWRSKPFLIGLAHSFQQQQVLSSDSWDVPVAAIVTERQVLRFY